MSDRRSTKRLHESYPEPCQDTSPKWERNPKRTLTNQTITQNDPSYLFQQPVSDLSLLMCAYDEPSFDQLAGIPHYPDNASVIGTASDTTSFQNIEMPFNAMSMDRSSSLVMVQSRANSDASNKTFGFGGTEDSDEPYFSTPSQNSGASAEGNWEIQGEFAVDLERMRSDGIPFMPHSAEASLGGMCNSELYRNFGAYGHTATVSSIATSSYQGATSNQLVILDGSKSPWTPLGGPFRVPSFPPGYPAFAPSPEPAAEQNQEDIYNAVLGEYQIQQDSVSPLPEELTNAFVGSHKGKEKAAEPGWEHTVIRRGGLQVISEMTLERAHQIHKRNLTEEQRERAARIRKIKACWPCWLSKTSCSEGEICERCLTHISTLSAGNFCSRDGFRDFVDAFFPEYFHSHLQKKQIEGLINEHARRWTDQTLTVDITIDPLFTPIQVSVTVFIPRGDELSNQYHLETETQEQSLQLMRRYSAPVGLLGLYLPDLKQACKEYIEAMIDNPLYDTEATLGDATTITYQILQIIRKYFSKERNVSCKLLFKTIVDTEKKTQLVRNAYMLHAIHLFMSRLVTFSESSARSLYQAVLPSAPQSQPYLSSRLLNRQIKYAMHKLHRELIASTLDGLEKSLRKRTSDFWGPSFATILVLCLCIEGVQIAADTFVVCDWEKCRMEGVDSGLRRSLSENACMALEEWPWELCMRLFHEVYKSRREIGMVGSGGMGGNESVFNPLRDVEVRMELDGATREMVSDVCNVVGGHWVEVLQLAQHPPLVDLNLLLDAGEIRANNTGRLAAKFLLSFF